MHGQVRRSGEASDVVIEQHCEHAVPVGTSDGALMFCDCMMLSFQIEDRLVGLKMTLSLFKW